VVTVLQEQLLHHFKSRGTYRGAVALTKAINKSVKSLATIMLDYVVTSAGKEINSKESRELRGKLELEILNFFKARSDYPQKSTKVKSRRPFVFEDLSDALTELTEEELRDFNCRVKFYAGDSKDVLEQGDIDELLGLWNAVGGVSLLLSDLPYNQKKRKVGTVTSLQPSDCMQKSDFAGILAVAQRHLQSNARVVVRCNPNEVEEKRTTLKESRFNTMPHPIIVTKSSKVKTQGQSMNNSKFNSSRGMYATYVTGTKSLGGSYANRNPFDWTGDAGSVAYDFGGVSYVPQALRLKDSEGVPYRDEVTWQEFAVFIEWFTEVMGVVLDVCAGSGPLALACIRLGRRCVIVERDEELMRKALRRAKMFYKYLKDEGLLPEFGSLVIKPPTREEIDPADNWVTRLAAREKIYTITRASTRKFKAAQKLRRKIVQDLPKGVLWNAKVGDGLPEGVEAANHVLELKYDSKEAYHKSMKDRHGIFTMEHG